MTFRVRYNKSGAVAVLEWCVKHTVFVTPMSHEKICGWKFKVLYYPQM